MKQILIDRHPKIMRTALVAEGQLQELFIDKSEGGSLVGRVILGTVRNILPSQFAFIDIGLEKNAFMNLPAHHGLKSGQPVLVQVYKDPGGSKGAYVGQELHLNGRLVIIYENNRHEIGISQKITEKKERERLRKIVRKALQGNYGVIVRTNCQGKETAEIASEIKKLTELHRQIKEKAKYAKPTVLLYPESGFEYTLLNDLLSDDVNEIWFSGRTARNKEYSDFKKMVKSSAKGLEKRIYYYNEEKEGTCLFDAYGINRQIEKALQKTVWLPCGGFVTFEQTEACVVVDVNTGHFAGKKNYRETILQTNLEAASCIAKQLALRNLSGMIIVDFIDMHKTEDKQTLINTFSQEIKKDRIKTEIVGMTELGLVQLTRRKTRTSLSRLLEEPCRRCEGTGRVKIENDFI